MMSNLTPPLTQSVMPRPCVRQEAECAFNISSGVNYFTLGSKLTSW